MSHVLEGRAAIQTNNLGHGLTSLAYFCKGRCNWDTITLCNRMGWTRQQICRKELEVLVYRLNMDQPVFLWFCEIKMSSRDLRKGQNNVREAHNPCELNDS